MSTVVWEEDGGGSSGDADYADGSDDRRAPGMLAVAATLSW